MAIYLVDYENVYIEGLKGLEELGAEDVLHIFYTQNRCGLTFHLYEQLTRCKADIHLNEVPVSLAKNGDPIKNALDIQLMMFAGYVIGAKQTDRVYIVSKDKDFCLGQEFYKGFLCDDSIELHIIPAIANAFDAGEDTEEPDDLDEAFWKPEDALAEVLNRQGEFHAAFTGSQKPESFAAICEKYAALHLPQEIEQPEPFLPETQEPKFSVQYHSTVRNLLGKGTDDDTVSRICEIISAADTLVDLNNGLARFYRDGERAKEVYHKCKPRFEDLRHLSRARNKG